MDLHVTLLQIDLEWENPKKNLQQIEQQLTSVQNTDLIVLPEMFTTGFSMQPQKLAETMEGTTLQWMKQTAMQKQAAIMGSLIIKEEQQYYNRLIWVEPNGKMGWYDKRHLFSMANEDEHYTAGTKKVIWEYKTWKICPLVCYDLRFPVWSRNVEDYDLAIYVANWPEKRTFHWKHLLVARSIENQCYTIGVNRIGTDGNGHYYSGDSSLINPAGELLFRQSHLPCLNTFVLSKTQLLKVREKLPFLQDRDHFLYQNQ